MKLLLLWIALLTEFAFAQTGLPGVVVHFSNGATAITDASGNYSVTLPMDFTGTATPVLAGYTFATTSYSGLSRNQITDYTATPNLTTPGPDTTPPKIAITYPINFSTIPRNGAMLTCVATDNVKVVGVQWTVDGVAIAGLVTAAPFSLSWVPRISGNGWHILSATAFDGAGNKASKLVWVRFQ